MGCAFPEDILSQTEAAGWVILRPGKTETGWLCPEGQLSRSTPGELTMRETVLMLDGRQSHTAQPIYKGEEDTLKRWLRRLATR